MSAPLVTGELVSRVSLCILPQGEWRKQECKQGTETKKRENIGEHDIPQGQILWSLTHETRGVCEG